MLFFSAKMGKQFLMKRIKQVNPKAAEQFEKNPEELERLLSQESEQRELMKNPNSLEAQKAIEEAIRQQNILHNMEAALEANPESFGHIDMLYLRLLVDGHAIDAFVDTGAQITISKAINLNFSILMFCSDFGMRREMWLVAIDGYKI